MNYLRKIFKPVVFTILFILISLLIITLLNYFNILGYKLTIYLKFILGIIAFVIGGFQIGVRTDKKGWLEGLRYSLIIIIPIIVINIIVRTFEYKCLIFYSILTISSIIGSMLGITKNKETS